MKVVLITCFFALTSAVPGTEDKWVLFKKEQGKSYKNATEEEYRRTIFLKNQKLIDEHNARHAAGEVSYTVSMNHFGDLTAEEFKTWMTRFNMTRPSKSKGLVFQPPVTEVPVSWDWRKKGAVTHAKNQGSTCGSCWAFSSTGAMEGQLFLRTGKLVSLSEQQLIDCSDDYGNMGCIGGIVDYAFSYLEDAGGLASEESYPYKGEHQLCNFTSSIGVEGTSVKSFIDIPQGDEVAMKAAVALVGPVSVAINADDFGFQYYNGGIFTSETCQKQVDHGILVVGYGSEDGKDFWIIKNSWGTQWGEEGFGRMARNSNMCGIASSPSYPVLGTKEPTTTKAPSASTAIFGSIELVACNIFFGYVFYKYK